jgi:hypothetical protein
LPRAAGEERLLVGDMRIEGGTPDVRAIDDVLHRDRLVALHA